MATFIGDYPCKVDAKGRIILPMALKRQMKESVSENFVVKKDIYDDCLILYPILEWEKQLAIIRKKLNPYNRQHNRFLREFLKGMAEITPDSNNRLLLPKRLLELAGIKKNVVLAGQDGKIEIWDSSKYEHIDTGEEEFADMAEKLLGGDNEDNDTENEVS